MAVTEPIQTSSAPWIPEDDLLLKNSIEAGASLEALAKGAVQFSRAYTFRELRDRWHSLLYDPDVSAQASSRMMELELSGPNSSSKISRSENAKSSVVTAKRKMVSIRKQYNAMRKRLRCELFNSSDIGFLEPNMHDSNGHAGDFHEHVTHNNGPADTNCMLRDSFQLQDSDFDILNQVFPPEADDIGTTTVVDDPGNVYQTQGQNLIDDNHSIATMREGNLYGFPQNISPLIGDHGRRSIESNVGHETVSHMLANDSMDFEKIIDSDTQVPLLKLPGNKHFEADNSNMKRSLAFHSTNEPPQMGSGFAVRHINSPDSDGSVSLHTMGFSSSMPRLPLWKTMEDISVPAMPVHMHNGEISPSVEAALALPGTNEQRGESSSGLDILQSGPLLRESDIGNCFSSGAVSEVEFADLSDSLLNFPTEDELMFMNVDGKDKIDKSCYGNVNSSMVSSAGDAQKGGLCNTEPNELNNLKPCTKLVSTARCGFSSPCVIEKENITKSLNDDCRQSILPSEVNSASTSMLPPDYSQLYEENICCVLNTEDTEIPCNDDIFLLIHPSTSFAPARKSYTTDPADPASSADEKDNERGLKLAKAKDPTISHALSPKMGTHKLTGSFNSLMTAGCKVTSQVPDSKSLILKPGEVGKTIRDPVQNRSAVATNAPAAYTADRVQEQDVVKVESRVSVNPSTSREPALIAEAGSVEVALPKSVDNPSASDQDESESEYDVPYSSDIEAMILEMDLGPHDQDSHSIRQDEDAKKKIIRLEQCARASLQRMMSSHGALAFLYGRHLKHYIKKPEVLLGRSTGDVDVDIDLRKEGRANKISRRQATIKMETNGSFFLKNLGKSSISVNGKAVGSEQSMHLSSSCLIEIKGMSFVFEINHKYVRRYLDTVMEEANLRPANMNGRVDMKHGSC
ncbi:Microspherule protein [Heracleum sosnowskyi]|uniref:Microspherule protein n=1 Tax=Heracleum sosnowskyi TaxID=360622 RepID=A0AAD8GZ10_9APIA|nr:Microspherule protein [Heracleum sosnowskyi]